MRNFKSRATDIERRFRKKNEWRRVSRKNNEYGDAFSGKYGYIEIKSTIVSPLKKSIVTFRGIRNWEKVDKFLFIIIDLKNISDLLFPNYYIYLMDKKDLKNESLKVYNQNKEVAKKNILVTKGIDFTTDERNETFNRWNLKYCAKEKLCF